MIRFSDLLALVREASSTMDCWVLTSGTGFNAVTAKMLKDSGITGCHISLDHWDPSFHNRIRNHGNAFSQASEAVQAALQAGIIVSLSLCAMSDFVSEENLMKYASLARDWGVHFIRILEPRAAGKYSGKNVHLDPALVDIISRFAIRMNTEPQFSGFPVVNFLGYHQRQMPCFGAGNRFLYVDPSGYVHACPFCRGKTGNLLDEPFRDVLQKVKNAGCPFFN